MFRCQVGALLRAVFLGPTHEHGPEAAGARCLQVVVVGGDERHLVRRQSDRFRRLQVGLGLRLVAPGDLGAENGVPRESAKARQVQHARDMAVRQGADREALLQPGKTFDRIGPWIEPLPGAIEVGQIGTCNRTKIRTVPRQDGFKIFPLQHIQPHPRPLA